jgi:hypothetical protein
MSQGRSITVRTNGFVQKFEGDPQIHTLAVTGTHFITLSDPADRSNRIVVWQQRVENGYAEAVEITFEGFDVD